ncbi:MAG: penicillin-binding protein activator LpoB [Phycisphaerales bacterium]|nr:penicillin-binding protein activator LpoB [Phycisphaerales bacterium]
MRAVLFCVWCLAFFAFVVAGCSGEAVNKDRRNSFLTADDLVKMTAKMAMSITSDAGVARIIAQKRMLIVMKPVENATNEIIRPGEKEMYVHRVRALLSSEPALRDKFVFVLNRVDYEKLRAEEGLSTESLGSTEERVQPEYALWGTFYANTNVKSTARTDTYLCVFKLTKLSGENAGEIIWENKYETSKHVKKSFLD